MRDPNRIQATNGLAIVFLVVLFSLVFLPLLFQPTQTLRWSENRSGGVRIPLIFPQKAPSRSLFEPNVSTSKVNTTQNMSLPFSGFTQNVGQLNDQTVGFFFSKGGMTVAFGVSTIFFETLDLTGNLSSKFSLSFPGSQRVSPIGHGFKKSITNYFYGSNQLTDVPSWEEVWYPDLYLGVTLRYYMSPRGLKYEFILDPGADPNQITVQVSDSMVLTIEKSTVVIQPRNQPNMESFQDSYLYVFQEDGSEVPAQFIPKEDQHQSYGFFLDQFDPTQKLTIDPLLLAFSTYLGGSGNSYEIGKDIVVDTDENSYITGYTQSSDFPVKNAYQSSKQGGYDVFVTKLNASGEIVFSTYFGGSQSDYGSSIALDINRNIYITGRTSSTDFPLYNAYQSTSSENSDVFVTIFNPTGSSLLFSTYLGGNETEYGYDIAVDNSGAIYVAGHTQSTDFPLKNAYQSSHHGGTYDVFIAKFDSLGTGLIYSTYLGGSGSSEYGLDIVADALGNSYITGWTESSDFPIKDAYQSVFQGGGNDAFVAKLNTTGDLVFSTYLGGSGGEEAAAIALDSIAEYCYVVGMTSSSDFPIKDAYQSIHQGGDYDVFMTRLNTSNSDLIFSTYIGGTGADFGNGIALDSRGAIYVTGETRSDDFPVKNPYQSTYGGTHDAFVTKLFPTGAELKFSSYLGGDYVDNGIAVAVDSNGTSYVTGRTYSDDFPTVNAYDGTYGGTSDVFVTKIIDPYPSIFLSSPKNGSILPSGTSINFSIDDDNLDNALYNWDGDDNQSFISPWNTTLTLSDGWHWITIYANDSDGFLSTRRYRFYCEVDYPTILLISPENNSMTTSGAIIILNISDFSLVSSSYHWDGENNQSFTDPWQLTPPTSEGYHWLNVYAEDIVGHVKSEAFLFKVNFPPVITLNFLRNGSTVNSGINYSMTFIDTFGGLNRIWYKWDSQMSVLIDNSEYFSLTEFSCNFSVVPTTEGWHLVTVSVNDTYGHVTVQKYRWYIVLPSTTTSTESLTTPSPPFTTATPTTTPTSTSRDTILPVISPSFEIIPLVMSLIVIIVFFNRSRGRFH